MKLKHICAIFGGGHDVLPSPRSTFFFGGGRVPLSPAGFTPLSPDTLVFWRRKDITEIRRQFYRYTLILEYEKLGKTYRLAASKLRAALSRCLECSLLGQHFSQSDCKIMLTNKFSGCMPYAV